MADDSTKKVKSDDRAVVSQKVLFVRNLPFSTTDQDLENVFSEIGPIKRCFVIRNKGKKLCNRLHVDAFCKYFSKLILVVYNTKKIFRFCSLNMYSKKNRNRFALQNMIQS